MHRDHTFGDDRLEYEDPLTSDPMLKSLENRMRAWLEYDGTKKAGSGRVSKLHRSTVEVRIYVLFLLGGFNGVL